MITQILCGTRPATVPWLMEITKLMVVVQEQDTAGLNPHQ